MEDPSMYCILHLLRHEKMLNTFKINPEKHLRITCMCCFNGDHFIMLFLKSIGQTNVL